MEKEITYKQVGIANRRDGFSGTKVTGRRIFAVAYNGQSKVIPTDTIAKAKFTIDMAIQFGVPVVADHLDFTGQENLWWSFIEVATNSSCRTEELVAETINYKR